MLILCASHTVAVLSYAADLANEHQSNKVFIFGIHWLSICIFNKSVMNYDVIDTSCELYHMFAQSVILLYGQW